MTGAASSRRTWPGDLPAWPETASLGVGPGSVETLVLAFLNVYVSKFEALCGYVSKGPASCAFAFRLPGFH